MRRLLAGLVASMAGGLVLPGMASAAVFCVPDLAVAPDCGTPRATVGVAVNDAAAQSGEDTVRVGAGSFTPFTAVSSSDLTTIVGAGVDQTFVEGSGNITIVSLSGSFALKNLTVRRTTGTGLPVASLQTTYAENVAFARTGGNGNVVDYNSDPPSGGPALKNVTITSAAGANGDVALSAFNMSADGLIVDTTGPGDAVSGNGLTLKHMKVVARNPIAAVSLYATSSITDSLILATGATAEGLWAGTNGATTSVKLRNSTIVSADGASTRTGVRAFNFLPPGRTVTLDVRSTIVTGFQTPWCAGTGTDATQAAAVTLTLAYTMASTTAIECPAGLDPYLNTAGSVVRTVGPGTVAAAPQFVNPIAGDYAPLPGGNLIDAGDPAPLDAFDTTTDLLGAARVTDGSGDGVARRDIGALEGAAVPFVPVPGGGGSSAPSNPKVLTVRFAGTLKRASVTRSVALTPISKAPSGSKPGFTITLDRAPATLTFRVARRGSSGKYSTLKGSVSLVASGTTLRLRPSGSWNRKRLAKGTYQLRVSAPDGATKSATFKIK